MQLLNELDNIHGKVFYMGSTPEVLKSIERRLSDEHPNITFATHSPSYCSQFSDTENQEIIEKIESFAPDALLVGLTAPKQEKWVYANLGKLTTPKVIGNIGGAFEFYAGTKQRAGSWAISHHMEWLVRLLKDPIHMWRRNFISAPKFIIYNLKHYKEM
jgi:N-acetylglucosaminyldiphosphoundecaprenol N-acetyl-beta-D-mannosaminyltransferase